METLSEATQEYLESIYWLYEAGIERTQANLARALQVSQPSASEMLRRLTDDGLVSRDDHKLIQFTERGREVASRIVARHRTVEAYLVKVMGIPWDEVHEEAHAMEHSISPRLEAKMLEMIGEVRTCPHGHPIGDYPREPGEAHPGRPGRQRAGRAAARERGRGDAALPEAARRRAGPALRGGRPLRPRRRVGHRAARPRRGHHPRGRRPACADGVGDRRRAAATAPSRTSPRPAPSSSCSARRAGACSRLPSFGRRRRLLPCRHRGKEVVRLVRRFKTGEWRCSRVGANP